MMFAALALTLCIQTSYEVTDLHVEIFERAYLNDRGTVAGMMRAEKGRIIPFIWRHGDLDDLSSTVLQIHGLNNHDALAIIAAGGVGSWSGGSVEIASKNLSKLPGAMGGIPIGIDDKGGVLSVETGVEGLYRVGVWPGAKGLSSFDPLPSFNGEGACPYPTAVGPDGTVAGVLSRGRNPQRTEGPTGFLYANGKRTPIGGPGELANPRAVSSNLHVVGEFSTAAVTARKPFEWFGGQFKPLPFPENAKGYGQANAVNDKGDAVGQASWVIEGGPNPEGHFGAVLWSQGACFDLNSLISQNPLYDLYEALGINQNGQILVMAHPHEHPWPTTLLLLTPAPR